MKNNNWFLEQCLNCRHLLVRTNIATRKKTYACDCGIEEMRNYDGFNFVGENDIVIPNENSGFCESYADRFVVMINQEENN